jgi:hypothetical protein
LDLGWLGYYVTGLSNPELTAATDVGYFQWLGARCIYDEIWRGSGQSTVISDQYMGFKSSSAVLWQGHIAVSSDQCGIAFSAFDCLFQSAGIMQQGEKDP